MRSPVKSSTILVGSTLLLGLTFGDAVLSKAAAQSKAPSARLDSSSSSSKLSEVGKATTLPGVVNRLTFGLDGKRLIVECAPPPPTQPRIQGSFIFLQPGPPDIRHTVWDLNSHRVVSLKPMAYSYGGKLLAPDLRTLAVWRRVATSRDSARSELVFHDVATQRKMARPKTWKWLGDKMEPLEFSPDGKIVAVKAERSHGIVLIDVETDKPISKIQMDDDTWMTLLPGVVFSGNGKVLAVPLLDEKKLALCDVATGKVLSKVEKFERGSVVALTSDGKMLAVGNPKFDEVRLWDVAASKEFGVWENLKGGANDLAFSGNGRVLFVANNREVVAWSVARKKEIDRLSGHREAITVLAVSRDGKYLASGGGDKAVRLWDVSAYAGKGDSSSQQSPGEKQR